MNGIIIIVTIALSINPNLLAQNLKDFTGIYAVIQRCWEANNNWQETTKYEIEINYATNDSTNLEVHLILFEPYTLGFNVKNDIMFLIYGHEFLKEDSIKLGIAGNGVIYEDSIDLNLILDHIKILNQKF